MDPVTYATDPTLSGGFWWGLQSLADVTFRWIPATIVVVTGHAPDLGVPAPMLVPLQQPVTTADVAYYLQAAGSPAAFEDLATTWEVLVALSVILSLLLVAGIIYCIVRIFQIRHNERLKFLASAHPVAAQDVSRTQLRWNHILEEIHSENQQNWRLAILEADIMLNDLLDTLGYRGETMGDKMKSVVRGDFKTIDMAWEAHKARNAIAHQGMLQELTSREARRIIGLYEKVFREFRFVE
jgi:hypothetical protein